MLKTPNTILVTNDDGWQAPGIKALVYALRGLARIVVVAPDAPRSGASRSFTCTTPVRLQLVRTEGDVEWYACTGTPVDCVKLAFDALLTEKPILVASGINLGDNASVSIHYSGTMGAAIEGALKHTPSIGFSLATFDPAADYSPTLPFVRQIAEEAIRDGMPDGTCLNVNFPPVPEIKGTRRCRAARGEWIEEVEPCNAPRGGQWYWFTGRFQCLEPDAPDTDMTALAQGYASIVETNVY